MNLHPPVPIRFLGIGLTGNPMAMNLMKAGYQAQGTGPGGGHHHHVRANRKYYFWADFRPDHSNSPGDNRHR